MAKYKLEFQADNKTVILEANSFKVIEIAKDKLEGSSLSYGAECPFCGMSLEHVHDDDDGAGNTEALYTCPDCETAATYSTPSKYAEYHEVPDNEAVIMLDLTETEYDDVW